MAEQDFLTRIRDAESDAEAILAQAIEQGRQNQEKARQDALEKVALARLEADMAFKQRLQAAENQAAAILAASLQKSALEADDIRDKAKVRLDAAVQAVQERIVSDSARR